MTGPAFLFLFVASAGFPDELICRTQSASAFSAEGGSIQAPLNTDVEYLLRELEPNDPGPAFPAPSRRGSGEPQYGLFTSAGGRPRHACFLENRILSCGSAEDEFVVNLESLQFVMVSAWGDISREEASASLVLFIGECESL